MTKDDPSFEGPSRVPEAMGRAAGELAERLGRKLRLIDRLDRIVEEGRRRRLPLEACLERFLPAACEGAGARGALVRALDERLERRTFRSGAFPEAFDEHVPWSFPAGRETLEVEARAGDGASAYLVVRELDCAGEPVGVAAFAFEGGLAGDEDALSRARGEVLAICEVLDNYVEGIAAAARKQRILVEASGALRHVVLEEAADRALALLGQELDLEAAALAWRNVDAAGRDADPGRPSGEVHYRIYRGGSAVADSHDRPDAALDADVAARGQAVLAVGDPALAARLGGAASAEEPLAEGIASEAPIGKLAVRTAAGGIDPAGADVLRLFAECFAQRLVDYHRERRHLSQHFDPRVVTALLRESGYRARHLVTRTEPIAILFADITGFTAISEQVLQDAHQVGDLIDAWGDRAVRAIYEHGGTFDKMVGDCVIGLFGPPFFASTPEERVLGAVESAIEIGQMTRRMGQERGLDARIAAAGVAPGLGVATGVNFGPTSVGFFGPNEGYTGFSSAMNNAARLQGIACFNEILVAAEAGDLVAKPLAARGVKLLGPEEAKAKNVRRPIRYYRVSGY